MSNVLDRVLQAARQLGASDVHLKAGLPPIFRIRGDLRTVRDVPPLSPEVLRSFASGMMNPRLRAEFEESWDVDLAYAAQDGSRYRVNVFQQRGAVGMVMRLIPPDVPPFENLNLPPKVLELAAEERGLVLVTGITGSGKSTTLAAMVDSINSNRACHIVTIEDPIEYAFRDRRSVINQRELGFDTKSFSRALRAALRQDPDVILVGEMRDQGTVETGLRAAMTGHVVLSSLHTNDALTTPIRLLDMGAPRYMVAMSLHVVVAQRLVRLTCDNCAEAYAPLPQEMEWLASAGAPAGAAPRFLRGTGCSRCNGTGFHGRSGVYEMLEMSKPVVDALGDGGSGQFIDAARRQMAGRSLRHGAARLALGGRTTVAEAMRVSTLVEE